MSNPDITLYTASTPNGYKVTIALEYLNINYKPYEIQFNKAEQKQAWFLKINPNGRIPAIVDHKNKDFSVFESGAILLYLAENYDPEGKLLPKDKFDKSKVIQWLMWQMGGLGPMLGQAIHFNRYAKEKIEYGINRYNTECERLFSVLETHLNGRTYLIGDTITLADIANFPWVRAYFWAEININKFPNVSQWLKHIESFDFVKKGLDVPSKNKFNEMQNDKKFAEQTAKEIKNWVFLDDKKE